MTRRSHPPPLVLSADPPKCLGVLASGPAPIGHPDPSGADQGSGMGARFRGFPVPEAREHSGQAPRKGPNQASWLGQGARIWAISLYFPSRSGTSARDGFPLDCPLRHEPRLPGPIPGGFARLRLPSPAEPGEAKTLALGARSSVG